MHSSHQTESDTKGSSELIRVARQVEALTNYYSIEGYDKVVMHLGIIKRTIMDCEERCKTPQQKVLVRNAFVKLLDEMADRIATSDSNNIIRGFAEA